MSLGSQGLWVPYFVVLWGCSVFRLGGWMVVHFTHVLPLVFIFRASSFLDAYLSVTMDNRRSWGYCIPLLSHNCTHPGACHNTCQKDDWMVLRCPHGIDLFFVISQIFCWLAPNSTHACMKKGRQTLSLAKHWMLLSLISPKLPCCYHQVVFQKLFPSYIQWVPIIYFGSN